MLGVGGGIVYVAIFTSYLKNALPESLHGDPLVKYTIANAVFALIFAGVAASLRHITRNTFYWRPVVTIGLTAAAGAIITTALLSKVSYSSDTFAVIFSLLLIPIIVKMLLVKIDGNGTPNSQMVAWFLPVGIIAGVIMGVSGLGGGLVIVPVLSGILNMNLKRAISVSLGVIALTSIGLTGYNLFSTMLPAVDLGPMLGPIILPMTVPVIIGVLIGAPLGVTLSARMRPGLIRALFVAVCATVILKLFIEFVI